MRHLSIFSLASTTAALVACGGSSSKPPTFIKPPGTVTVNFSVDDTANKVFTADATGKSDLQWKGAGVFDPATNSLVSIDPNWGGPWATLYDDGPWTSGGHEPAGATAGDHIWGVAVFVKPPATGSAVVYEYGLNDNLYQTNYGNGWIWPPGPNGTFTVAAGATADIKADGLSLKKFGTTDLQLTIDKSQLAPGTWDTSKVVVKGGGWAWGEVTLTATGNTYVYTLSDNVGVGKKFPHTGLFNSSDKPEFIYMFNSKEYKTGSNNALTQGITAGVKASGASSFTPVTIGVHCKGDTATTCTDAATGGNGNSYVTIP